MKKEIKELIKLAETDRNVIKALKEISINAQKYELAAALRDLEVKHFPESITTSENYKELSAFKSFLKLFDLNITIKTVHLALEAAKVFIKKEGDVGIEEYHKIKEENKKIFG